MLVWNAPTVRDWKYEVADWVVEPGLPDHHSRIIQRHVDPNSVRWYSIFDTRLAQGHSDYSLRRADELDANSRLESRPHPADVGAILQRTESCRYLAYSLFARTDCESLQRWIHTGDENARWSPQVVTGVAALLLALAFNQPKVPQPRTQSHHRS